jgi:hypothetical protein
MSVTLGATKMPGGQGSACNAYLWAFDDGSGATYTPDVTKLTVQTFSEEHTPEFETTATDDNGNVAAARRGPIKVTFNVVGFAEAGANLLTYTDPAAQGGGCKIDITSHLLKSGGAGVKLTCAITKWTITKANNEFAKVDLTAESYFRLRDGGSVCCPLRAGS